MDPDGICTPQGVRQVEEQVEGEITLIGMSGIRSSVGHPGWRLRVWGWPQRFGVISGRVVVF